MSSSLRKIRILIVDDSAVMRAVIRDQLKTSSDFEVVGTASSGADALKLAAALRPDVITLDVQMPGMDGLETLDALLSQRPVSVIMVSAQTQQGAATTLDALDRGAMDYVAKPERGGDTTTVFSVELARKVRNVAGANVSHVLELRRQRRVRRETTATQLAAPNAKADASAQASSELDEQCIAIGISTGGPPALCTLLENLIPPLPPIVIVQHMPPQFTKSLAWRLDSLSRLSVSEATTGDTLRTNHVLVAPGGQHLRLRRRGRGASVAIFDGPTVSGHRPSVDVMMTSAAEIFGPACLGVIMTGMGRDGVDGCRRIRAAGGYVLGQDEATSDVYGMNKAAFVEGHVDRQIPLDQAAAIIMRQVKNLHATA